MSDMLPRQHASGLTAPWSLDSDNQLRSVLETALAAVLGKGVVSGGAVTQTAAFTIEVATATVLFCKGVSLTLSAAASHSGLTPSTTNYLWGTVTRTARDRFTATALDTYALVLTHNTTGTPPSDEAIALATITTDGSGITGITEPTSGKYFDAVPGSIGFTIGTETANVIPVTLQVKNRGGVSLPGETPLTVWLVDSASKTAALTATAPDGGWAAGTGRLLNAAVTNKLGTFITTSAGSVRIDLTHTAGAGTWYVVAQCGALLFLSGAVTFA